MRSKSDFVHGIEVRGNAEFRLRTRHALALLFPLAQFQIIRDNVQIIRQARRSGMKAAAESPTFLVGKPTWSHSPAWYAGAIAHDAYHAELYSGAKQRDARQATASRQLDGHRGGKTMSGLSTPGAFGAQRGRGNHQLCRALRTKSNLSRAQQGLARLARLSETPVVEIWQTDDGEEFEDGG